MEKQSWVIDGDSYSESYTYNDPAVGADASVRPKDGSLASVTTATGDTVNYGYDALKRLTRETVKDGENTRFYTAYAYKDVVYETQTTGQVEYRNVRDADGTLIDGYKYTYDALGNITGIYESEIAEGQTERRPLALYEYDAQSQLTKETLYTYTTDSNGAVRTNTAEWNYTYDSAGNLLGKQSVAKGIIGSVKSYSYDNEQWKDLLTAYDGEYILYEGQRLVEQEEPLTGVVTVRVSGEPISGNPIHYYNGMHYDMEWEQGRDLAESSFEVQDHSASNQLQWVDKENTIGYSYDADGIRTSKAVVVDTYRYRTSSGSSIVSITPGNEVNALDLPIKPYPGETYIRFLFGTKTVTHNYVTQNGKVVRETIDDGVSEKVLDFIYDTAGKPFALIYTNGTAESETYYYVLNLQGDVVKLLDEDGAEVASYRYNAWGKLLSVTDKDGNAITSASHIANLNPIRYRGYYYDAETGFYYLRSRYYDPVNCRFVNADALASTGQGFLGCNMFAYCNNNPVNGIDPTGKVVSRIEFGNEVLLYDGVPTDTLPIYLPPPPLGLEEAVKAVGNCVADAATDVWNCVADVATDVWNCVADVATDVWNCVADVATDVGNCVADVATDAWKWTTGTVDETLRRLDNVDWDYVLEETQTDAIVGMGSCTAVGYVSAKLGAPFTAGASIPVCIVAGAVIGVVGGGIEGFLKSFLDEFKK